MERNPAVKLIDHFKRVYGKEKAGDIRFESKIGNFVRVWLATWEGEGKGVHVESSG